MLFFTFIKGGVTPPTGTLNLNGFSSIIWGGVKSLLTNVNKKMFFFNEGFPKSSWQKHIQFLNVASASKKPVVERPDPAAIPWAEADGGPAARRVVGGVGHGVAGEGAGVQRGESVIRRQQEGKEH